MSFRDQIEKFEGERVKVSTVNESFEGRLKAAKSDSLILNVGEGRESVIRYDEIIAVTEIHKDKH